MTKALYTQVGEIKGKKLEGQTSFTHQFTPTSEELKNSRGSLYALISLANEEEINAVKIERDIFQTLQSSYFSGSVGGVLVALESAFAQTQANLAEKERTSAKKIRVELVAAVLWGEALYLVKTQNTEVIFQRDDVIKKLKFNKTASGAVRDSDNILLVNNKFSDEISTEDIVNFLKKEDFQEAVKSLDESVSQKEGVEALLLRVNLTEPKQQPLEIVDVTEKRTRGFGDRLSGIGARTSGLVAPLLPKIKTATALTKEKLSDYSNTLFNKILAPWRPREPGAIEDPAKRRRAKAAQIAVVLIILLSLSVGLALTNRANSAKRSSFNEKLAVVEGTLGEAENLAKINPERAEELLVQAEQGLSEAKDYGIKDEKLSDLEARYASLQETVRKIHEVSLEEIYSFSDAAVTDLTQTTSKIILIDKNKSKVYLLDKNSKEPKEIASLEGINQIAVYGEDLYAQITGGIKRINLSSSNVSTVIDSGSGWGSIVSAATYQGNLYLLDSEKREVWKYTPAGSGLTPAQAYFKNKPDLGEPVSMAVDGVVWVGNKDGRIFKFLSGKEQKFEINGLDKPLGEITDIYTSIDGSNLFVLDKSNGRVVIIDKGGRYISQQSSGEFKDAGSIAADEKNKSVYVGIKGSVKMFKYK